MIRRRAMDLNNLKKVEIIFTRTEERGQNKRRINVKIKENRKRINRSTPLFSFEKR